MTVTVLMPFFNAAQHIFASVESILSQTFTDFELLLIDDGSKDKSLDICQEMSLKDKRIKIIQLGVHRNISVALNTGLAKSVGKYIVRADADDWSYPYRLEKQVLFMEKNLNIVVSGGHIEVCDENLEFLNHRKYPETDSEIRGKIFRFSPFAHPATIWRAESMKSVGGYDESLDVAQDYDLYFRVGKLGKFANINDVLIKLRTHPRSSSMKRGRRQEQVTIQTRYKAVASYGYKMSLADRVYTVLQALSVFIIPARVKFWLFNFIRSL